MRDKIGRDGIHPDDDQRDCPPAVLLHVDDPGERREEEETDPAAEERPARSPDALTMGQIPVTWRSRAAAARTAPAIKKRLMGILGAAERNHSPARRPRRMVPIVGDRKSTR